MSHDSDSSKILIRRSSTRGRPVVEGGANAGESLLQVGELALSFLPDPNDDGFGNGGDRLYVGTGDILYRAETNGNGDSVSHFYSSEIHTIGGKYFTDMLNHQRGEVHAASALLVDDNKKLNELLVDYLYFNKDSVSTEATNDLTLRGGTGNVIINSNLQVTQNVQIDGTLTVDGIATLKAGTSGTIIVGDSATDNVQFGADINSNLLPNITNTYNLGDSDQRWKTLWAEEVYASGINVQAPAEMNSYYIYVGNDANKLSALKDPQAGSGGYTYDQSFATLPEAAEFLMKYDFKSVGYNSNRDKVIRTRIILALEDGAFHGDSSDYTVTFDHLSDNHLLLVNQRTLDPAGGSGAAYALIRSGIYFNDLSHIQVGGGLHFSNTVQLNASNVYNWNGQVNDGQTGAWLKWSDLWVDKNSEFYTNGFVGSIRVRTGARAYLNRGVDGGLHPSQNGQVYVSDNGHLGINQNVVAPQIFVGDHSSLRVNGSVTLGSSTYTSSSALVRIQENASVFIREPSTITTSLSRTSTHDTILLYTGSELTHKSFDLSSSVGKISYYQGGQTNKVSLDNAQVERLFTNTKTRHAKTLASDRQILGHSYLEGPLTTYDSARIGDELRIRQNPKISGDLAVLHFGGDIPNQSVAQIDVYDGDSLLIPSVMRFRTNDVVSGNNLIRMTIDSDVSITHSLLVGESLTVGGDLIVNGTTTTINSTELTIDDKRIIIAQGTPDSATANNAGIAVGDSASPIAYMNYNYNSGDARWEFKPKLFAEELEFQVIDCGTYA